MQAPLPPPNATLAGHSLRSNPSSPRRTIFQQHHVRRLQVRDVAILVHHVEAHQRQRAMRIHAVDDITQDEYFFAACPVDVFEHGFVRLATLVGEVGPVLTRAAGIAKKT